MYSILYTIINLVFATKVAEILVGQVKLVPFDAKFEEIVVL